MCKVILFFLCCCVIVLATSPDAATKRWWSYTEALGGDKMQGRATGSQDYERAEAYVVRQFRNAGLSAAGTNGFAQPVPFHSLSLQPKKSPLQIVRDSGKADLAWFRQITVAVRPHMPDKLDAPLYFLGDASSGVDAAKVKGAAVVMLGVPRIRRAGSPVPMKAPQGAAASLTIDSLGGPEPPIWPLPYAKTVTLAGDSSSGGGADEAPAFRVNPAAAEVLFAGSGHSFAELKKRAESGEDLPNFPLSGSLRATLKFEDANFKSDNILAVLPGADPVLRDEYVVLSAHLDGYGIGEARHGDSIYNGAFDDAAYVALLMDLAQRLHDSGTRLKRSLLFCVVTGEEKGLLGSKFFAQHPTVPKEHLVADLNLDQLRPIFPLRVLTTLALRESTLGETVQQVAKPLGIRIQEDPEPERNLLRRSDHYSFMQIGVPAVNFVFGYEKGSAEEKVYRSWYSERYHSPADDLQQPWVPEAAAKFNRFYSDLVKAVANQPQRPHWTTGSQFAVPTS